MRAPARLPRLMTEDQIPSEETELTAQELAEEQSIAIDALTGEVVAADDDDEGDDVPEGISSTIPTEKSP